MTFPLRKRGIFPFTLHARGFQNTDLTIDIDKSSQFLSALLIAAPLAKEDVKIKVAGTHGMAYIEMTCRMMEQFGVLTEHPSPDTFLIKAGQTYRAQDYAIEPDVSAACYFMPWLPCPAAVSLWMVYPNIPCRAIPNF